MCNKTDVIHAYLLANEISIMVITETWLKDSCLYFSNLSKPKNYSFSYVNRETKGGGIGIFYLSTLKVKNVCKNVTSNWEYGVFEMNFNDATFCLLCVYRIPGTSVKDFLSEFNDTVSQFMLEYKFFCILGDFNIPLKKPNPTASSFISCIEELNLVKHSSGSTHINGNQLDVILSNDVNFFKDFNIDNTLVSDHYGLLFDLLTNPASIKNTTLSLQIFWSWREADLNQYTMDVVNDFEKFMCSAKIVKEFDPHVLINIGFNRLNDIMRVKREQYAKCTVKKKHVGKPKYFEFECLIEKRKKRKLERKMKLDKSETNVSLYKAQLLKYRNVLARKRDRVFHNEF